jgi:hypothetical protein
VRDNTIAGIMPAINATFSGAGMTGSSGHEQNLAKGLAALFFRPSPRSSPPAAPKRPAPAWPA